MKEMENQKQIRKILTELGIEKHLKGYKYWIQIIKCIINRKLDSYNLLIEDMEKILRRKEENKYGNKII